MYKSVILRAVLFVALLSPMWVVAGNTLPAPVSKVTGFIVDSVSNKPMQYTNVVIKQQGDSSLVSGTISDANGKFVLENIPYGKYFLEVNFIGYERRMINLKELNRDRKNMDVGQVVMNPAVQNLKSVDIVADRNYVTYEVDKRVVNVSKNLSAQGGTAAEALEDVPSVRVDADGTVNLRGSSSFMVLVDGRPSPVDAQTLLKSIPANSIENIEIITNPSAKYDPDGATGILNIVMKKEKITGFNGMVNSSVSSLGGYGVSANLNYRTKRVNYYMNGNYHHGPNTMKTKNIREMYHSDTTGYLFENTDRTMTHMPKRLNAGADIYLNDKDFIRIDGVIGGFSFIRDFQTQYEYFTDVLPSAYTLSHNEFDVAGVYYGGGLAYDRTFAKDHRLEFGIGGWRWDGKDNQLSQQYLSNSDFEQGADFAKVKSLHENYKNNLRIKVDYTVPLGNSKLEMGAQTLFTTGISDYTYHNYDLNNSQWNYDSLYSNSLQFDRNLISSYATYTGNWKGISYMAGLRFEYMDRLLDQKTMGVKYPVELWNYYPSMHLSRKLGKKSQVQASYSRRINRPRPWELNPFPDYSDAYNVSMGNPELKPEDIDSYELNFIQQFKTSSLSVGSYYRQTNNTKIMAQQIMPDRPEVMFVSHYNLDKTYAYGAEMTYKMYLAKWFNYTLNVNAYHYHVSASIAEISSTQTSNNLDANLKLSFDIKKKNKLEFTAFYNSPGADGQGQRKENYFANLAFRTSVLKNKGFLVVSVQDVFGTSRYRTIIRQDAFYSRFELKNTAPVVRVSFNYRINNYKRHVDKSGIGGR